MSNEHVDQLKLFLEKKAQAQAFVAYRDSKDFSAAGGDSSVQDNSVKDDTVSIIFCKLWDTDIFS